MVAQLGGQFRQILHGAQPRLHLPVAAHRIASVVVAGRHLEHRHQVQIGDPQFAQIGDTLAQALQVSPEQVHVAHGAHHAVGLVPVRIGLAHGVQRLQFRRAGRATSRVAEARMLSR